MIQLPQILSRIPAFQGRQEISVERIAGLTNANYCLSVDGERYVLRVSGPNTGRLGIDRNCELAALQAAAAAGLAPDVIAFLPPEGHLVTRWVDGRHWDSAEFRTSANVRLLTETARRIHDLPPNGATFSPFRKVEAFLETAQEYGVPFPDGIGRCLETMQAVESEQRRDPSIRLCLCHNDLVSVNYLFTDQERSLKVLDWEFAGLGDPYYDLATVVYTHDSDGPIPPDLEEEMLACYFGVVTPAHRRRLAGMKYMLMLFTGAWGLAQHGMQCAELVPPVEGFDYLEFAGYLFANVIETLGRSLS